MTSTQRREVENLLFDQNECVTVGRLATRLHISRTEASRLLADIQSSSKVDLESSIVSIKPSSTDSEEKSESAPCTVFSLKSSQAKQVDNGDFLYALSPASENSGGKQNMLPSVNEQTLAVWRDMIQQRETGKLQDSVEAAQDMLASFYDKEEWKERWAQYQIPSTDLGSATVSRTSSISAPKKKSVTAASFFGAAATKASSSTASSKSATQKSSVSKTSKGDTQKQTSSKATSSSTSKKRLAQEKENKNKQKVDSSKSKKADKPIGNADDFVGDMDEEEDEEDDVVMAREVAPPSPKVAKKKKTVDMKPPSKDEDVEMINVEDSGTNDFDTTTPSSTMDVDELPAVSNELKEGATKRRPRRKKLVEKTTVDAKGWLHVEMEEVWEDIPSDEDEATKPKPTIKKKPKASKMKQGSIASFFKK